MMDRFECVKARPSTAHELKVMSTLATATLAPDHTYAVHDCTETMIDVLETLDFALYSETCCTILLREYGRDPKALDSANVCKAIKEGGGNSHKAAQAYMWLGLASPNDAWGAFVEACKRGEANVDL